MKKAIKTANAPAPIGPYNQAIEANGMVFISGQIAINPISNELELGTIEEETTLVMKNLEAILKEAGCTFNDVVKTTILLLDMSMFTSVNTIYGKSFSEGNAPARETFAVKGLPKGVNVEISMIAVKG